MNELQLRTTEMFGKIQTDIYENENHDMFIKENQACEVLQFKG